MVDLTLSPRMILLSAPLKARNKSELSSRMTHHCLFFSLPNLLTCAFATWATTANVPVTYTCLLSAQTGVPFVCPGLLELPPGKGQESRCRSDVSLSRLLIGSKSPVTYKAICLRHCGDSTCSFVSFSLATGKRLPPPWSASQRKSKIT